jgi:TonB family protein
LIVSIVLTLLVAVPGIAGPGQENATPPATYSGFELLTPTQGVDFDPFLRGVYYSVKTRWFQELPQSVALGEKGTVALRFKINRDGKVVGGAPRIEISSRKKDLDKCSVETIRHAGPFQGFPQAFEGPNIEARVKFYFNEAPPEAKPKA